MVGIYVFDDVTPHTTRYSMENGQLVTSSFAQVERNLTGTVGVYTYCPQCTPVYFEGEARGWRGDLSHMSPRCQWLIVLDRGSVTAVHQNGCETREQTRQKLRENGQVPIPDDDRAVKKEIEIWRAGLNVGHTIFGCG
jgi:hypothetical protein